jgi:hypothetical protein
MDADMSHSIHHHRMLVLISAADAVVVDLFDPLDFVLGKIVLSRDVLTSYSALNWLNWRSSAVRLARLNRYCVDGDRCSSLFAYIRF